MRLPRTVASLFTLLAWLLPVVALGLPRAVAGKAAASSPSGLWVGTVVVAERGEIPFRLAVKLRGSQAEGTFWNGDDRVQSTSGTFAGDALTLKFDHYAGILEARWTAGKSGQPGQPGSVGKLEGTYSKSGQAAPYPLHAGPFAPKPPSSEKARAPSIAGVWEIAFDSPKGERAWQLFVRQSGGELSASILRVDGDTSALTGTWVEGEGKFVLGHFSGSRATRLEITPAADGSLALRLNGKPTMTAVRTAEARARNLPPPADPSRWTTVKDPSEPLRFSGVDLAGTEVSEADPRFRGKVLLVNVMGSWCPNCHDEAPFLAALYRKYRKRGLEIVSLSFEDATQLANPVRLRAFVKSYGISYPVLLGGEPGDLAARLPQAVNLNTWPATFFIGRDGLVRGVHAGFASPATGEAHKLLKAELTRTVESLLTERRPGA